MKLLWLCSTHHGKLYFLNVSITYFLQSSCFSVYRCGHCKRLKPEYAKAAEELKINDPPIALAKVDCTEAGKDTCSKFGVSGYPTLKIFRNGEMSQEYNGPREAAGIVKYMKAQVGPSSRELEGEECLEKFLNNNDVGVVGFFEKDSNLQEEFMKTANKLREKVRFAHTSNKALLDKFDVKDDIILFRPKHLHSKFEDDKVHFKDIKTQEKLEKLISENYHGLVGHRKNDNYNEFKNPLVVAYYSVDYVKNIKGTNYWRNRILKVVFLCQNLLLFANICIYRLLNNLKMTSHLQSAPKTISNMNSMNLELTLLRETNQWCSPEMKSLGNIS